SGSLLFASEILSENEIFTFFKSSLSNDKSYTLDKVTLHSVREIEYPSGWAAYFITLDMKARARDINIKEVIFSDGVAIVKDFTMIKGVKSLKNELLKDWDDNIKKGDK
ncbi:MAG: hypothetical protein LBS73_07020, partial [Campylobacteraceae bacterium]|nr:hypothetical protein [Campylobacteraceae bacterium]